MTDASVPPSTPVLASIPRRSPGVDAARALSVMAMVFGHTAEALMSADARAIPWVQTYWGFRGLTAPIFLFVSGWAVIASVSRSGLSGRRLVQRHLPRVFLLFGLGLLLRLPAWDWKGVFSFNPLVWAHWLGFDALHCIAGSLLLGICLLAFVKRWSVRAGLLLALVVLVPVVSTTVDDMAAVLPLGIRTALHTDEFSPFPLFPWAGYFFAGALLGTLMTWLIETGRSTMLGVLVVAVLGAGMIIIALGIGVPAVPKTSALLFFFRLGQVALIAAGALLLPHRMAGALGPVGRSALAVYVAHLPLVYGWAYFPGLRVWVGPVLEPHEVAVLALLLLVFGLAISRVLSLKPWRAVHTQLSRLRGALP